MGYTKLGDPFVRTSNLCPELVTELSVCVNQKVGPVCDPSQPERGFKGHFISAGYGGHGMPRAFAWYVKFWMKLHLLLILFVAVRKSLHRCSLRNISEKTGASQLGCPITS
jgi:hypothetical protein